MKERVRPFDVSKHLRVSEELGKVDVEDVTGMLDHNVVVMTITDAEHVSSHAVARTAHHEVVQCLHTWQSHNSPLHHYRSVVKSSQAYCFNSSTKLLNCITQN